MFVWNHEKLVFRGFFYRFILLNCRVSSYTLPIMKITYLGHSSLSIETKDKTLLIDPFISGNELAKNIDINKLHADYILITHAHQDHILDVEAIAKRTGATVISNFEIGFEFNPSSKRTSYINNIKYRVGANYDSGYLNISNQNIDSYSFSLGLGFPTSNNSFSSTININYSYGKEGTTNRGLIQENFHKFKEGLLLAIKTYHNHDFFDNLYTENQITMLTPIKGIKGKSAVLKQRDFAYENLYSKAV